MHEQNKYIMCVVCQESTTIQDLPGLPAGVKFDPTDQELLEHLEGKARPDTRKLHPLVDEFIPTIDGENGICYTHPERLPGAYEPHTFPRAVVLDLRCMQISKDDSNA